MDSSPTAAADTSGASETSAVVVGRYVYYGGTSYFGDVLAPDKSVLLPTATATNAGENFNGGINNWPSTSPMPPPVTAPATSPSGSDGQAILMPGSLLPPTSITVLAGRGYEAARLVFIRWANGAIENEWLQVIFTPADDTFYLGNLVGNTGDFQVTSADEAACRANNVSLLTPAAVTNVYDFNHDGKVDPTDELIARAAIGDSLTVLTAPAAAPVGARA